MRAGFETCERTQDLIDIDSQRDPGFKALNILFCGSWYLQSHRPSHGRPRRPIPACFAHLYADEDGTGQTPCQEVKYLICEQKHIHEAGSNRLAWPVFPFVKLVDLYYEMPAIKDRKETVLSNQIHFNDPSEETLGGR